MISMDYKYSGSGWHTEAPVELKSGMVGASNYIDKITNTYLQFSVLF
jgi:hypothetical protein